MTTHSFRAGRLLRTLYGSEPFADYCRRRGIPFEHVPGRAIRRKDVERWAAALDGLPTDGQARVELELAKVSELSSRDATAHLIDALGDAEGPADSTPAGAPVALWFLLQHPAIFHEVFLHHEIQEVDSWRSAQAPPGIPLDDLLPRAAALGAALQDFFRRSEGVGQFSTVDVHRLKDCISFVAQIADRLRLLDGFTDRGEHTTERLRPAVPVIFVYYPADGTILLRSRLRARERVLGLMRCFGRAVLGVELPESCMAPLFRLDPLKQDFRPLPDGEDMEMVRIKALHLRYPHRAGRRKVKLETVSSDEPSAIPELLRAHLEREELLERLQVSYAELQVRLRVEGRRKSYPIRLWPNRSNLPQTPLGDRFRACLRRWGLLHGPTHAPRS